MTDREALHRAILADPDDDTLRLIYADALEEDGDARKASFIRTQVQLARLPEYDPVWIRARHHDRGRMFGTRWFLELPPLPIEALDWARDAFRRGFPANLEAHNPNVFVEHADELFAQYPIESLELLVAQVGPARQFATCPWLSRLVRLSITQGLGGQAASRLLNSENYERLRELHIGAGLTTAATATAIVRSPTFRQLTRLSCRDDRAGGRTLVQELTRLANPPRLRVLDLASNRLGVDQLTPLVAAPALSAVEEFDLSDNNLRGSALQVIAGASLPQLRSLHLLRTQPEEAGVRALAGAAFMHELRSLTLGGNNLPAAIGVILGTCPAAANLRVLDLRENRLGNDGAAALANSSHLRTLAHLDLASNEIGDAGADALSESPHLGGLICLDLHGNAFSQAAVGRLKRRFGERVFL